MKNMMHFIKRIIKKIFPTIRYFDDNTSFYTSIVAPKAPWVYISYISEVFHIKNSSCVDGHQNKQESLAMVPVLNELGYNVCVQDFKSIAPIPKHDYKLIFGLEPNFERACADYPKAKKIYYATGAYYKHQNKQVRYMTDLFNITNGCTIPYRRLVNPHKSCEIADKILQIGSKYTISTYPLELHEKISIINQSTLKLRINHEINYAPENEFMFIGSTGNMLKGIPLLIDYFSKRVDIVLHLIGPIEEDVKLVISRLMTPNIILHGFKDLNSFEMQQLFVRCNFMIYPSGTEGLPGAVLAGMSHGLIPIVTKWAAFDEIEDYGYLMNDWTVKSVGDGIEWAFSLNKETVQDMKVRCQEYVIRKHNLDRFCKEFRHFFENL